MKCERLRTIERSRPALGFTLIEVMVAVAIMAVIATLAWRGIDGMARSRDISEAAMDRTQRLGTVLTQWERDLQAVQPGAGVPALAFDGASLRLTREVDGGVQLVIWTLRESTLARWASPPTTRANELQETWLRSQQLLGDEPGTLKLLQDVSGWQVYFYRGNGWSNAQSSGDQAAPPAGGGGTPGAPVVELLPTGVRLQLNLAAGGLTRDVLMSGQGY
ncbi:MAG: prepilin-type N-terminal cleavage/methylation domain-containing protein [Rubrivivax sp.]|nr:prepilin-type N-terminal cleavage/methylation domain-containing protein [Rubrivivax sp.]